MSQRLEGDELPRKSQRTSVCLCEILLFFAVVHKERTGKLLPTMCFTVTLRGKFAIKRLSNIPPHFNCVATLPCKI